MYRSDSALQQYFSNVFNDDVIERAYVVRRTGGSMAYECLH